jgi:hypothetical protein
MSSTSHVVRLKTFFLIIGPYEHNNQTSNKVNNAINNNQ